MENANHPELENRLSIKRPYFVETEFVLPGQENLKRLLTHLNWVEDWENDCLTGAFSTTLFILDSVKVLALLKEMKKNLPAAPAAEAVAPLQSVTTSPWSQNFTTSYPALAQEVEQFHHDLLKMTLRHAKQGMTYSLLGCLFHDTRGAVLLRSLMQQLTDQQLGLQARMVQLDAMLKAYQIAADAKGLALFQQKDFQAVLQQETQHAFLWHLITEDDREIKVLFPDDNAASWRVRCQRDHLVDEHDGLHHLSEAESRHLFQSYVEFITWRNEEWIATVFKGKARVITPEDIHIWQQEYAKLEQLYKLSQTQLTFFQAKQDELQKQRQRDYLKWLTNPDIIAELSKHPKLPTLYRQIFEASTLNDIQPCLDEENWQKLQKLRLLPTLEANSHEARALANWFRNGPIDMVGQLLDNLLNYEKNILRRRPDEPVAIPEGDELLMTIIRQTIISHLAVQHLPYFSIKAPAQGLDLLAQLAQAQRPAYATMYFLLLQGASHQQLDFQAMPAFIELIQQLMEFDRTKLSLMSQTHQNLDSLRLYQQWWQLEQAAAETVQHQFAQALQKELVPLLYFSPTEDTVLTVGSYPGGRRQLLKRCDEQRVILGSFIVGLQARPERETDESFKKLIEDMRKFYQGLKDRIREAEHSIGVDDALLDYAQDAKRYQEHFRQYAIISEGIKKCLEQIYQLLTKYAQASDREIEKWNRRKLAVITSSSPLVRRVVEPMLHTIQELSDTINNLKESQTQLIEVYWQQSKLLITTQQQLEAAQKQNDSLRQEIETLKENAAQTKEELKAEVQKEVESFKAQLLAMVAAQLAANKPPSQALEGSSSSESKQFDLEKTAETGNIRDTSVIGSSFSLFPAVNDTQNLGTSSLVQVRSDNQFVSELVKKKG